MSDILFTCPNCRKPLAVDAKGAGMTVACTDCHKGIVVPAPSVFFLCPSCHGSLSASEDLFMASRDCPTCGIELLVPKEGRDPSKCPHCAADLGIDEGGIKELVRKKVQCLQCDMMVELTPTYARSGESLLPANRECAKCRTVSPPDAKFCMKCGTPVGDKDGMSVDGDRSPDPQATTTTESQQQDQPSPTTPKTCPSCSSHMTEDAVICVQCGTDLRTGTKVKSSELQQVSQNQTPASAKRKCPGCRAEMDAEAVYCVGCGTVSIQPANKM
jgi:hypothetical protein